MIVNLTLVPLYKTGISLRNPSWPIPRGYAKAKALGAATLELEVIGCATITALPTARKPMDYLYRSQCAPDKAAGIITHRKRKSYAFSSVTF